MFIGNGFNVEKKRAGEVLLRTEHIRTYSNLSINESLSITTTDCVSFTIYVNPTGRR